MLLSLFRTPLADIWHDTAFQFVVLGLITLIAGAIGGIISYWIFRKQRIRREVTYQVLTDTPLASIERLEASINTTIKARLRTFFDEMPQDDMSLFILKVRNSGNVDIRLWNGSDSNVKRNEYEVPIRFEFVGRDVISIAGLESDPPETVVEPDKLKAYLTRELAPSLEQRFLELPQCVLKPKQSIRITALLRGSKGRIIRRGTIFHGEVKEFDPVAGNRKL